MCESRSGLPAGDVVVEHDLQVSARLYERAHRVVAGARRVRVDVQDLPVPLVLEQQSRRVLCDHRVVRGRVRGRRVRLPVVETTPHIHFFNTAFRCLPLNMYN